MAFYHLQKYIGVREKKIPRGNGKISNKLQLKSRRKWSFSKKSHGTDIDTEIIFSCQHTVKPGYQFATISIQVTIKHDFSTFVCI